MGTPAEVESRPAPRRPRGEGLPRARVAGATLIVAPGGQLLATALASAEAYDLAVLAAAGTLAWLPALQGLAHFLERRTEALGLLGLPPLLDQALLFAGAIGLGARVLAAPARWERGRP